MAQGELAPLTRAVQARIAGEEPSPADLAVCKELSRLPDDLLCWNGQRSDRPQCGPQGSQNIPIHAMAGLGPEGYERIAQVCRIEAEEGNFGKENGSPSSFYYGGVVGCKQLAFRELGRLGQADDAESVRRAIRSNLAWDAISSYPVARMRDEVNEAGQIRTAVALRPKRKVTVAVSGMRWTPKERATLTSEDSHSEVLVTALGGGFPALTDEEASPLRATVDGDLAAAREVASWMFGTIDTPEPRAVRWKWRLRRTTLGAESVFLGSWPNPMKPMRVVTHITRDGFWKGMRPSPKRASAGWARDFKVSIEDGIIHSSCVDGEAEQPELGGDIVWQVEVDGSQVRFDA